MAFMGIHVADPAIFGYMKKGVYSMTALYIELSNHQNIFTYCQDNCYFRDIGSLNDLEDARKSFTG